MPEHAVGLSRRRKFLKGAAIAGAVGLAGCIGQDGDGESTRWRMGTSSEGSAAFELGQIQSAVVDEHSDILRVDPVTTPGYSANMRLISDGEVEMAKGWSRDLIFAHNDEGDFEDQPVENPPIQAGISEVRNGMAYYTFADSDVETVQDLEGLTVNPGPAGGGTTAILEETLETAGIIDDVDIQYLDFAEQPDAVRDGRIDVWNALNINFRVWTPPHAEIFETEDVKLVEFGDNLVDSMTESEFISEIEMDQDLWSFEESDVPDTYIALSMASSMSYVPTDASSDLVYEFVKLMDENIGQMAEDNVFFKPVGFGEDQYGLDGLPEAVPFHEGAAEYFQEIGEWDDRFSVQSE